MNNSPDFKIVFKILSRNLFIISVALLCCVGISIIYSESYSPFILSASISFALGYLMYRLTKNLDRDIIIQKKDAFLTVTMSWLFISLIGSLPYLFSGSIPGVTDAIFESVSGFTTTGSSVLTNIEALPKSILFWRSLTHWIGGMGIIVLVIIVMPSLQIGGYNLFTLESSMQEKIKPKIKSVGYRLLWIYLTLTVSEVVLLRLGNMNLYESVCHAFGTVATGGFSPKNTSLADYSPYIQYIIMLFMLLSGINFAIHYYFLKRDFKKIRANEEVRFHLLIILILGSIVTLTIYSNMDKSFEESFREAFFQIISVVTCTGYSTADYLLWPALAWILVFFAMFFGGSTGSTAGGIKMVRHLILFKSIGKTFQQLIHPNAVLQIRINKNSLSEEEIGKIFTFISIYILIIFIGIIILMILGVDAKTASGSVATCMAGIGPGIGTVGPASNFAHLPELGKMLLAFLMLVGRLEIYTVIILFTPYFWSNKYI